MIAAAVTPSGSSALAIPADAQVRQWLDNYRELKTTLEALCELNQQLLLDERSEAGPRRQTCD